MNTLKNKIPSQRKNQSWKGITYKVHKRLGLAIMIPVLLWVVSGLMHPFMANWFRPEIAQRFIIPQPVSDSELTLGLKEVLVKNNISAFNNARLIELEGAYYYQVALTENELLYLNATHGTITENADLKYAEQLARIFLDDQTSALLSSELITEFDTDYREINRLLPAWKLTFDRPDGMEIYIETSSSRLGAFNSTIKKIHGRIFQLFHNWGFIPGPAWLRLTAICFFSAFVFITALAGLIIYGFAWKRFKNIKHENNSTRKRKLHRKIGLVFSLFMFMFAFSGWFHAIQKFKGDNRHEIFDKSTILTASLDKDFNQLIQELGQPVINFSLANFGGESYFRIMVKEGKFAKPLYFSTKTGNLLSDGEAQYAKHLAKDFANFPEIEISEIASITQFKGEYGFVNKRLPVQKVLFKSVGNPAVYVETSTGKLGAIVTDSDRMEGYSFAFLHKFHFLDGFGKNFRDILTMLAACSLLVTAFLGWRISK
ncbi:PepSY-associated TM helix domain-containing protein [Flexithrix dorotheae]|uniref:PepSY-associated TM helix domain-containing protein n=1 Tax=Flexithrix dorotheae TaxID=70993 RepID=UPI0003A04219|nr:PepSY-associated TM helix domain-containing protein [Flexithrix dorotheae]